MPHDKVDAALITNEPHKWKLGSYFTNEDNVSGDRDQYVKKLKHTIEPGMSTQDSL